MILVRPSCPRCLGRCFADVSGPASICSRKGGWTDCTGALRAGLALASSLRLVPFGILLASPNLSPMSGLPLVYILDGSVDRTGALVAVKREAQCLGDRAEFVLVVPASARVTIRDCPEFA